MEKDPIKCPICGNENLVVLGNLYFCPECKEMVGYRETCKFADNCPFGIIVDKEKGCPYYEKGVCKLVYRHSNTVLLSLVLGDPVKAKKVEEL